MVETEIRESVQDFARLMSDKLNQVEERHPNGWGSDTIDSLFQRAEDRMDKLFIAMENGEPSEVIGGYCVDVSNWMHMIADNVGYLTDMYGK